MYLSDNELKSIVAHTLPPEKFARLLTEKVVEVEALHRWELDHVVVGAVKAIKPHPNADRLRLVETLVGERTLTIVCGGKNLYPGQRVAVALEGAMVRWHGQGEKVKLEPATIRGVKSEGMICAASELDLPINDRHPEPSKGSREILRAAQNDDDGPFILDLTRFIPTTKPGTRLDVALGLDDVRYEIDNKSLARRADLWGYWGMSREVALITGARQKSQAFPSVRYAKPTIAKIQDKTGCWRYIAARIGNVRVVESPWEVQQKLIQAGLRPINLIVDLTNLVMIQLAQPMHAFDARSIDRIIVRRAKAGERLIALNGKEYGLSPADCVIANSKIPMALAGIIGGEHFGIQQDTTSIIVESATFDPVMVRKTSQRLLLRTDSSARFEKGQPVEMADVALRRFLFLLRQYQPNIVLAHAESSGESKTVNNTVRVDLAWLDQLIGPGVIPVSTTKAILKGLGMKVGGNTKTLIVTAPYWRNDVDIPEDIAEEVSRIFGFNSIPDRLPDLPATLPYRDGARDLTESIRSFLVDRCAMDETESYPFEVPQAMADDRLRIEVISPISQDSKWLRTDLGYNVLEGVAKNLRFSQRVEMFEIGKVFHAGLPGPYPIKTGSKQFLPDQPIHCVVAISHQGDLFRSLKGRVELMGQVLGWEFGFKPASMHPLLDPAQSIDIHCAGQPVGILGLVSAPALRRFDIKQPVALLDLNLGALAQCPRQEKNYTPMSAYPSVLRDIAVVMDHTVPYEQLATVLNDSSALLQSYELFDEYTGKGLPEGKKSLALHLRFSSSGRTLTNEEVDSEIRMMTTILQSELRGDLR
ncbi:phenylalanine--tRNA ligase subunit beta [Candidatus Uhrbacteria bacterium]|nr:phenylalanine--tRNA ligase subunit beta [Candidatus Uhrbacteria bacterium]